MDNQPSLSIDKHVDLQIAHLNMIQGSITRMSGFSAGVKNFCVTISAGIIAVAFQKQVPMLLWAAAVIVLIFGLMDGYYLALEKRYRQLYENVSQRPLGQASNMSLKAENLNLSTYLTAARSISVTGFYALLLIGVLALLTIANHDEPKSAKTRSDGAGNPSRAGATCAASIPTGPGASRVTSGAASASIPAQRAEPARASPPPR